MKTDIINFARMMAGIAVAITGGDAAAINLAASSGGNAAANNYLNHNQLDKYGKAREGCEARGDCAAIDATYRQISQENEAHAKDLIAASKDCGNNCAAILAELRAVENDLNAGGSVPKFGDGFSLGSQLNSAKVNLERQFQQQWCSGNPAGCALAIASPLFPALAAAAPALAADAISACTLNPAECTATINSMADGLLADGAAGAAGLSAARLAAERAAANGGANFTEVWKLSPTERGIAIESQLAQTEYKDWFNVGQLDNGKFPLIDFQNGNTLVSLKTVDTTGSTWMQRMEDHILDLRNAGEVNGIPAQMVLDIRVQPGGLAAAMPLIQYGKENGIAVVIKEYK